jgi:hypothetical protein
MIDAWCELLLFIQAARCLEIQLVGVSKPRFTSW